MKKLIATTAMLGFLLTGCATSPVQEERNIVTLAQKNARLVCSGDYRIENGKLRDSLSDFYSEILSKPMEDDHGMVERFADHVTCIIFAEVFLAEHPEEVSDNEARIMQNTIYRMMQEAESYDFEKKKLVEKHKKKLGVI